MNSIYLISGPLGAGKSSLSRLINKKYGYALIDGDAMFGPLENVRSLEWSQRLKVTWKNILEMTKNYLSYDLDVVIDFVVEDELDWFISELGNFNIRFKYVVLVAKEDEIKKRLIKRDGGLQYQDRSLVLLNQLQSNERNKRFILDTTGKTNQEVCDLFISGKQFEL